MTHHVLNTIRLWGVSAMKVVVVCGLCLLAARADEPPTAGQPLVQCALQNLPANESSAYPMSSLVPGIQNRGPQPLDNYQRGFGAQWRVPAEVNPEDPTVRLMLLAPGGPLLLDVAVYVNGQSFRSIREHWIDGVLRGDDVATIIGTQSEDKSPTQDVEQQTAELESAKPDDQPATPIQDEGAAANDHEGESETDPGDTPPAEENTPDNESADESPARVEARRYEPPGPLVRLKNYADGLDGPLEREEARWLLAQWVPGPTLLELRHGYAWERAAIAPLLGLWDESADGALSSDEIRKAGQRLAACDLNQDETVELREILRARTSSRSPRRGWTPPRLIAVLDHETDWSALAHDLTRAYSADGGQPTGMDRLARRLELSVASPIGPNDLARLSDASPDLTLRVCFGESASQPAGVAVTTLDPALGTVEQVLAASEDTVVVELGGTSIEIAAAGAAETSGQISCGAVVDGYPLLRHLDSDGDQRFTSREMQHITEALQRFDRDGNQQIDADEIRVPIRLAFAQGPRVHSMLAEPRGAAIREESRPRRTAPIWFTPMDGNSDGDITRAEFFGTDEQFRQLDADGDGLVSVAEAIAADAPDSDSPDPE